MYNIHHLSEGIRILNRRISVGKNGVAQYNGTAEEISKAIIEDCWNNLFFQVSNGHFSVFYMRDFGMCVQALICLGYIKKVLKTLQFALAVYSKYGHVFTTISHNKRDHIGFDVFSYAPDTLAFLLYSLRVAEATELVEIYKPFLEYEIQQFYEFVVNKKTGLVQSDKHFSSIKDNAKRQSCCYDNCCVAVVVREAKALHLLSKNHPLQQYDYKKIIKNTFWTGSYFLDTITTRHVAGDANVFPFWFDLFTEKTMMKKAIEAMRREGLDKPFPLKYTNFIPKNFLFPLSLLAKNYEGTSIWTHLGLCYIDVVAKIDMIQAKKYSKQYRGLIEKHKNFLEIFSSDGSPYKTLFYHSDEAMLWASKWLAFNNKFM